MILFFVEPLSSIDDSTSEMIACAVVLGSLYFVVEKTNQYIFPQERSSQEIKNKVDVSPAQVFCPVCKTRIVKTDLISEVKSTHQEKEKKSMFKKRPPLKGLRVHDK